jgi:hypothetical protein
VQQAPAPSHAIGPKTGKAVHLKHLGGLLSDHSKHSCTRKAKVGCKHSGASICGCRQKFSPKVIPQQVRAWQLIGKGG